MIHQNINLFGIGLTVTKMKLLITAFSRPPNSSIPNLEKYFHKKPEIIHLRNPGPDIINFCEPWETVPITS